MSSVRVPGSLRRPAVVPASPASGRSEVSKTSLFTAACLAAASPASIVLAQTAPGQEPLPPLSVEAKAAKKKAAARDRHQVGRRRGRTRSRRRAAADTRSRSANPYADPNGALQGRQVGLR